jgi:2-desacetyl-2-hydroxyethyl bacteriochlorophyllide A dehydrogenase
MVTAAGESNHGAPSRSDYAAHQLVYEGSRRFQLRDVPPAEPGPGECVIAVAAAGVCGSDLHGYVGRNDRRPPGTIMGHEASGRVESTGEGVGLKPGTRVALWPIRACGKCDLCGRGLRHLCRHRILYGCTPDLPGAFATELKVRAENLVALPGGVPTEWGALVEPLAVGHHAVALAELTGGERVTVVGGGAIGIAAGIAARRAGASEVVVVEPMEVRRHTLAALGFDAVVPEEAPADVDVAVECVGHTETARAALLATRPAGTVVLAGLAEAEIQLPAVPLVIEERRLLGSSAYTLEDFRTVAMALDDGDVDLEPMIERRVGLGELPGVFEDYACGRENAVRTLMTEDGAPADRRARPR